MTKEERDRWKRVMLWEESEEVQRSQFHFILGLIGFTILVATALGIWDHDWGALATVGYVILMLLLGERSSLERYGVGSGSCHPSVVPCSEMVAPSRPSNITGLGGP